MSKMKCACRAYVIKNKRTKQTHYILNWAILKQNNNWSSFILNNLGRHIIQDVCIDSENYTDQLFFVVVLGAESRKKPPS